MDETTSNLIISTIGILLLVGLIISGVTYSKIIKINNFQATIEDLSDEQKCMHICGFQYPGSTYFDNYKFCVEKCDRISERDCE